MGSGASANYSATKESALWVVASSSRRDLQEDLVSSQASTFTVQLQKPLGVTIFESQRVKIGKVHEGHVASYNQTVSPDRQILEGDYVVAVNGKTGHKDMHREVMNAESFVTVSIMKRQSANEGKKDAVKSKSSVSIDGNHNAKKRACINGCKRLAADGFDACCRTCSQTQGREHGPRCNISFHKEALDCGKDLWSRLDFAPLHDQNANIDFEKNKQWLANCLGLVQTQQDFTAINNICGPAPKGLVEYVRALQPVHRINQTVFRAVLRDGGLRSRSMQKQIRKAGPAAGAAMRLGSHPILASLVRNMGLRQRDTRLLRDAAQPMLQLVFDKLDEDEKKEKEKCKSERLDAIRRAVASGPAAEEGIAILEDLVKDLHNHAVTDDKKELAGVGYAKDAELGTDEHVFSVIGANMCDGYGDIVVILNPRIMQHPDFNMTVTAATSYLSNRTYFHRPWAALGQVKNYQPTDAGMHCDFAEKYKQARLEIADPDQVLNAVKIMRDGKAMSLTNEQRLEYFHKAKLHPSAVDWEELVAMDMSLQCRLFLMSLRELDTWVDRHTEDWRKKFLAETLNGRQPTLKDIRLDVVKTWYTKINAHGCIEGHLPQFVPLEFVDKILMPSDKYADMKEELEKYMMADGQPLSSRVVPIKSGGHYASRVRTWQANYFSERAATEFSKRGIRSGLDMRAFSFGLEEQQGKEVFLPFRILEPSKGFLLKFRVKGQHIRFTFSNQRNPTWKSEDSAVEVYMLAIGCFKNTKTFLKRNNKSGGPVCKEVTRQRCPNAMALPDRYREYWITFDAPHGRLCLGCGGPDDMQKKEAVLFDWTDPNPHQDIKFVAVSCWDTPVDFAMLKYSSRGPDNV